MSDPREAPEYVRVPVDSLLDSRQLLIAIGEARAERVETRKLLLDAVAEVRADLHAHVQAERPVIEAHGKYLASLADEETNAAARAVADRRTAEEVRSATADKRKAWTERAIAALLVAAVLAAERVIDHYQHPSGGGTTPEIGAPHEP